VGGPLRHGRLKEENRRLDVERMRAAGLRVWVTVIETVDEAFAWLRRLFEPAARRAIQLTRAKETVVYTSRGPRTLCVPREEPEQGACDRIGPLDIGTVSDTVDHMDARVTDARGRPSA
jgi:hypothetical protein